MDGLIAQILFGPVSLPSPCIHHLVVPAVVQAVVESNQVLFSILYINTVFELFLLQFYLMLFYTPLHFRVLILLLTESSICINSNCSNNSYSLTLFFAVVWWLRWQYNVGVFFVFEAEIGVMMASSCQQRIHRTSTDYRAAYFICILNTLRTRVQRWETKRGPGKRISWFMCMLLSADRQRGRTFPFTLKTVKSYLNLFIAEETPAVDL